MPYRDHRNTNSRYAHSVQSRWLPISTGLQRSSDSPDLHTMSSTSCRRREQAYAIRVLRTWSAPWQRAAAYHSDWFI